MIFSDANRNVVAVMLVGKVALALGIFLFFFFISGIRIILINGKATGKPSRKLELFSAMAAVGGVIN